jgi:hypothetical protein
MRVARFVQLAAMLAVASTLSLAASAPCLAQGDQALQRDSDDYRCHHGRLHSRHTLEACARLWGKPANIADVAEAQHQARQRDSDDYNCHHGPRGARRTVEACARLRGSPS